MGQRYSFHFRIFENNGGKKHFFSDKKQKKKRFWILFLEDFPVGIFSLYGSPPEEKLIYVEQIGTLILFCKLVFLFLVCLEKRYSTGYKVDKKNEKINWVNICFILFAIFGRFGQLRNAERKKK